MEQFRKLIVGAIFILSISLLFSSCENEVEQPDYQPTYLDQYSLITTLSKETIIDLLSQNSILPNETAVFVKYSVDVYKIIYKTVDYNNQPVQASGVLIVPQNITPMPLLSLQHGTITDESSAPSYFQSPFTDFAAVFSSTGYIIAVPDYLGYGVSKDMKHPYEHGQSLATACRDMIRASYEFFKVLNLDQPNGKLFLTGYSEGGFATMATFKLLQEEHIDELSVTAVTVGAGAYNKTEFANWVISSNDNLQYINSFVWVLDTYNTIYPNLNRPYSYYFNEPWDAVIQSDGVFAPIETNPQLLLNQNFVEDYLSGNDQDLLEVFADNDCFNWNPQSPLQLYHGTEDVYVPYFNSLTAYNVMQEYNPTHVELITIQGGDHLTSIIDYTIGTYLFFQNYLTAN